MNSVYDFIISPKNKRYNNEKKVGDKTLVLNTNIEDHKLEIGRASCRERV